MTWLLWRQHRAQAAVSVAALLLFGAAVVVTGVHMAHVYDEALRSCPNNGACELVGRLFQGYGAIVDVVHLSIAVPILLGAFVGVTVVARETEHATNVLVWSQTVTRRRWTLSKFGVAVGGTFAVSATVAALVTWWSGTPNALYGNRFEGTEFDTQNVVPVAFSLFAVGLGIAAGSLLRRTLPALAATVGVYAAVRVAVAIYVRPHYLASISAEYPVSGPSPVPPGSWTISDNLVDPTGRLVTGPLQVPGSCGSATDRSVVHTCLDRLGYHNVVRYHPASHYWHFQWTEAGIFVVAAAALIAYGIIHTLRHDA
jgi:hypothetical protein